MRRVRQAARAAAVGVALLVPLAAMAQTRSASNYEPAPMPNWDLNAPLAPDTSREASVRPDLFMNKDQWRGNGFLGHDTAQSDQERHLRPAPGITVRMPLQ
jgi:hypothetical protein